MRVCAPEIPCVGNTDARLLRTADAVRRDLAEGAATPALWGDAVEGLYERGTRLFLEQCPGHTLSRIGPLIAPDARFGAVEELGLTGAAFLPNRERR